MNRWQWILIAAALAATGCDSGKTEKSLCELLIVSGGDPFLDLNCSEWHVDAQITYDNQGRPSDIVYEMYCGGSSDHYVGHIWNILRDSNGVTVSYDATVNGDTCHYGEPNPPGPPPQEYGWSVVPVSVSEALFDVFFLNENAGWIVGDYGAVVRTANGGTAWFLAWYPSVGYINRVFFVDATTGWIVTSSGQILKSTDAGASWDVQTYGSGYNLNWCHFTTATAGPSVTTGPFSARPTEETIGSHRPAEPALSSTAYTLHWPPSVTSWVRTERFSRRPIKVLPGFPSPAEERNS